MIPKTLSSLQAILKTLGLPITDPAGHYGDSTLMAVKKIQHRQLGLAADGIIDQQLIKQIKKLHTDVRAAKPDHELRLLGRVIRPSSKSGIAGLSVKVFDSDIYTEDDFLGAAVTDADGWFSLLIDLREAHEERPDLYFQVYTGEKLLKSTQDDPLLSYRESEAPVLIEIQLPIAAGRSSEPSRTVLQLQKFLQQNGFLEKHTTGFLDGLTVHAYDAYREARQNESEFDPGKHLAPLRFYQEDSAASVPGLLVRVAAFESEYITIPGQSAVTDTFGRIRWAYEASKPLPEGHQVPLKLAVYDPADPSAIIFSVEQLVEFGLIHEFGIKPDRDPATSICLDISGQPERRAISLIIDQVGFESLPTAANENAPVPLRIWGLYEAPDSGIRELGVNIFKDAHHTDLAARIDFPETRFGPGPVEVVISANGRQGNIVFKAFDDAGTELSSSIHNTNIETAEHTLNGGNIRYIEITGANLSILNLCYRGADIVGEAPIADEAEGQVIEDACNCDHCTSALSPAAYYVDLLGFVAETFTVSTTWLEDRLRQALASVPLTCESAEDRKFYSNFVNRVLVNFIAERRDLAWRGLSPAAIDGIYQDFSQLPMDISQLIDWVMEHRGWGQQTVSSERLDGIYNEFQHYITELGLVPDVLYLAFQDILLELGTSRATVAASDSDPARQNALLTQLGLEVTDWPYLSKTETEVVYSDLERGFALILKSRSNLLFRSYRNNLKEEYFALKLEELLKLMDAGDPTAPADEQEANQQAEAYAEEQTLLNEPALLARAQADADEQQAEAAERIQEKYLLTIRNNLVFIAHNEARRDHYGIPVINSGQALGDYLNMDLAGNNCQKITYLGFLLEVLQSLITSLQLGREELAPNLARLNQKRWSWMKSYGIWHAIQSIFLYPDNFVFPGIRRIDNGWAGRGWSDFFEQMTEFIDDQGSFNLSTAQAALDHLSAQIRAIEGVGVSHMVATRDHMYLFCCNTQEGVNQLFYARLDRDMNWSGWLNIDLLGATLRKSNVDQECIQDVVVMDERVYVFYLVQEAYQARYVVLDTAGPVVAPTAVTDNYVSHLRAVVIRPKTFPQDTRPAARILAFYPNPDVSSSTAAGNYVPQEYLVVAIKDGPEDLTDAKMRINAGATLAVAASLSGLQNKRERYTTVLFAITGITFSPTDLIHSISYKKNADDDLWQIFNDPEEPVLNLVHEPLTSGWKNKSIQNQIRASRKAAFFLDEAYGSSPYEGTKIKLLFFNGKSRILKLELDNDLSLGSAIDIYPPEEPITIDSLGIWNRKIILHRNGFLIDREQDGTHNKRGQIVLKVIDGSLFFPLGVHVGPSRNSNFLNSAPVSTQAGRQYLKTVQALKFSLFSTDGYAKEYLAELFLHAPLYIAEILNEAERFEDANAVLSVVFQAFLSEQDHQEDRAAVQGLIDIYWPGQVSLPPETQSHRLLYYGFFEEDDSDMQLSYRGSDEFLDDPVNPHTLADHRPLTYARQVVQMTIDNLLDWADADFARDVPESVPLAREKYEDAAEILGFPDLPKMLCAAGAPTMILPAVSLNTEGGANRNQDITRAFCIPPNPIYEAFQFRAISNLEKIRTCRNIAGVQRALASYAAAADPTALVEAVAAGAELDDFVPATPPPLYRYSLLYDRARQLIQTAIQYEAHFLSIIEKYDSEAYSLEKARNDLLLSNEHISLRALQVRRAGQAIRQAELQAERTQISHDYFDELINEGFSTLEEAMLGTMIGLGASQAAVATGAAISGSAFALAIQMGIAAVQTGINILQTFAAYERREQEWQFQLDLATKDIDIANQGIAIAKTESDIAGQEMNIAQLNAQFARDAVEFLTVKQFANADLYAWMKKELRKLYRQQLNLAHSMARTAQQALAFELQEPINIIGHQYGDVRREDLLGAEKLAFDLEKLENHRFTQAERRREISATISLASAMPGEFGRFKQSGILEFMTPSDLFDRHFPGQYQRLIKSVEVSVIALIPPTTGIRATLSNHGISRVMTGPPFAEASIVHRQPESISLSAPLDASGLFQLNLDDPMLLPFEGSGVDTSWTLEMPQATNAFNFDTLVDVLLKIRYTAKEDGGYKQKVIARLREQYTNTLAVSAKTNYPDTWYHFHNPRFNQGPAPFTLVLDLKPDQFPANESKLSIKQVIIYAIMETPISVPLHVSFVPAQGAASVDARDKVLTGDSVSAKLTEFTGRAPYGEWSIEFDTAADPNVFADFFQGSSVVNGNVMVDTERFEDLLIVFEYGATLQFGKGGS